MSKEDLILRALAHIIQRDKFAQGFRDNQDSKFLEEINSSLDDEKDSNIPACDMSDLDRMDQEEDALQERQEK